MNELKSVLDVQNVSMVYRVSREKVDSFKEYFIKKVKKQIIYETFTALNDVSFQVKQGEVFGIIGLNGAGKSTLLKIVAGILKPTSGSVKREGSIAPLIELGAGFNGDLTGVENIILNGLLLGYPKKQIINKMDEIIEFAELGQHIHYPLKNYSSGMRARLGFAIATSIKPDLLIVDEVLSVGDIKFQRKCEEKIQGMIQSGTTVLFVSHSLSQVEKLCHRVMWLDKGTVVEIGETKGVLQRFRAAN